LELKNQNLKEKLDQFAEIIHDLQLEMKTKR